MAACMRVSQEGRLISAHPCITNEVYLKIDLVNTEIWQSRGGNFGEMSGNRRVKILFLNIPKLTKFWFYNNIYRYIVIFYFRRF